MTKSLSDLSVLKEMFKDHTVDCRDMIELITSRFIEVVDEDENTSFIPIDAIAQIKKNERQSNMPYYSVATNSGQVYYVGYDIYSMLEALTLQSWYEVGVPKNSLR